jgi:hypothetical protein
MVQSAKAGFEQFKPNIDTFTRSPLVPAQAQPFLPAVAEIVNTLTFSSSGDCFVAKAKVKMATIDPALRDILQNAIPSGRR